MKSDDPRLLIHIQHVLGVMAVKEHTASHECDQLVKDYAPECSISYEAGKRDALKNLSQWLRTYTNWDETLKEMKYDQDNQG
jgi:hypothetical protein